MGLTEIRPQSETSHATLTRVTDVAHTLETVVVTLKKERRQSLIEGFDVAPLKTALQHAADGVASVEDIDRAWIATMPSSIGPCGMIDALGLDTMLEITRQGVDGEAGALTRYAFLKRYVDEGRLGAKSGEGFYSYPDPAFMRPDLLSAA